MMPMNTTLKQRMAGAIFILSLGVILIPVILEKPLVESAPRYSEKPKSPAPPEADGVSQINYVFNEIEQNFEKQSEIVLASTPEASQSQEAPKEEALEPTQPAQPVPKATPTSAKTKVAAATASERISTVHGDWTIQLGAFSNPENANGLITKLNQQGFQSYIKQVPGQELVRVFVAPGVGHEDAEALLTQLNNEMGLKGIIVRFRE